MREEAKKYSGYVLASIPILTNEILCGELKKFLTSEPSESIRTEIGIPPRVEGDGYDTKFDRSNRTRKRGPIVALRENKNRNS